MTVKEIVASPFAVTTLMVTTPLASPVGTFTLIWVVVFDDLVAARVPNVTVALERFVPVIVTVEPTLPRVGLMRVILGGCATVNVEADVTVPAIPLKVTLLLVAPVGTTNVTVVSVELKLVATALPTLTPVTFIRLVPVNVMVSPIFFVADFSWLTTWSGVGMSLWLGVVTVALAYWAYSTGLRSVSPADATALTIVEPAAATLLAAFVLGEQPGVLGWLGIAVVIAALSRHAEPQR